MTNKRSSRFIAWLLTLVMILNLSPVSVFAENDAESNEYTSPELATESQADENQHQETNEDATISETEAPIELTDGETVTWKVYTSDGAETAFNKDMDPNKGYVIELNVSNLSNPGNISHMTYTLPKNIKVAQPIEFSSKKTTGKYDEETRQLTLSWSGEPTSKFTASIAITPDFKDKGNLDGGSYVIAYNNRGVVLPIQKSNQNRLVVDKSAQLVDNQIWYERYEDPLWEFESVYGDWYYETEDGYYDYRYYDYGNGVLVVEPNDGALEFTQNMVDDSQEEYSGAPRCTYIGDYIYFIDRGGTIHAFEY